MPVLSKMNATSMKYLELLETEVIAKIRSIQDHIRLRHANQSPGDDTDRRHTIFCHMQNNLQNAYHLLGKIYGMMAIRRQWFGSRRQLFLKHHILYHTSLLLTIWVRQVHLVKKVMNLGDKNASWDQTRIRELRTTLLKVWRDNLFKLGICWIPVMKSRMEKTCSGYIERKTPLVQGYDRNGVEYGMWGLRYSLMFYNNTKADSLLRGEALMFMWMAAVLRFCAYAPHDVRRDDDGWAIISDEIIGEIGEFYDLPPPTVDIYTLMMWVRDTIMYGGNPLPIFLAVTPNMLNVAYRRLVEGMKFPLGLKPRGCKAWLVEVYRQLFQMIITNDVDYTPPQSLNCRTDAARFNRLE